MQMRRAGWPARGALGLLGVGLAFAAVELGMRLHARRVLASLPYRLAEDPRLGFVGMPNGEPGMNRLGFRDREHDLAKAPGAVRIVVLGDSVTYGVEVPIGDRYTSRLEARLREQDGRVEVVNLGQRQYSTGQEVAVFEHLGAALAPDLLILAYVLNDPIADHGKNEFFRRQRSVSRTWAWLERRLGSPWSQSMPGCAPHDYYSRLHCDADLWAASEASLDRLAELTAAIGCPVLVVIFPLLERDPDASFASYRWRQTHRQVAEAARRRGFGILDLLPTFAGHRPVELKVETPDELHPNALGHRLAADAIADAVLAAGLPPSARPIRPRPSSPPAPAP